MSSLPIRAFNTDNITENMIWGMIFYVVGKGIDTLIKHRHKITIKNIKRTYLWLTIVYHFVSSLVCSYFSRLLHVIHLYSVEEKLSSVVVKETLRGFLGFFQLYPRAWWKIMKLIKTVNDQAQISKITGIGTDLDTVVLKTLEEEDDVEKNLIPDLEKRWS